MKNRAIRRQQRKKFLKRSLKIAKSMHRSSLMTHEEHAEWAESWAMKNHQHRKACSCQMCRNPRHANFTKGKNKGTWQEKRMDISEKESLTETQSNHVDDPVFD